MISSCLCAHLFVFFLLSDLLLSIFFLFLRFMSLFAFLSWLTVFHFSLILLPPSKSLPGSPSIIFFLLLFSLSWALSIFQSLNCWHQRVTSSFFCLFLFSWLMCSSFWFFVSGFPSLKNLFYLPCHHSLALSLSEFCFWSSSFIHPFENP